MWHETPDHKQLVISVFLSGDVDYDNGPLSTLMRAFDDTTFASTVNVDPYEHLLPGNPECERPAHMRMCASALLAAAWRAHARARARTSSSARIQCHTPSDSM